MRCTRCTGHCTLGLAMCTNALAPAPFNRQFVVCSLSTPPSAFSPRRIPHKSDAKASDKIHTSASGDSSRQPTLCQLQPLFLPTSRSSCHVGLGVKVKMTGHVIRLFRMGRCFQVAAHQSRADEASKKERKDRELDVCRPQRHVARKFSSKPGISPRDVYTRVWPTSGAHGPFWRETHLQNSTIETPPCPRCLLARCGR